MDLQDISDRGLVLLGCGKMGSALLEGWLNGWIAPDCITVLDPKPSEWLTAQAVEGLRLNTDLPSDPAVCLLAVKPQVMGAALPRVAALGTGRTLFVSIAAGTSLGALGDSLGAGTPIVRAMPNTPTAIGRGMTALIANRHVDAEGLDLAETLMRTVGQTVRLEHEAQMDAVTAVSGSAPAYVFLLIEALADAGRAEGLPEAMALALARATVGGAGQLAETSGEAPDLLRRNVTSPGGTTEAALAVLMAEGDGLPALIRRAVGAAAERSRALSR